MKCRVTTIFWQKLQSMLEWSYQVGDLIVIFWCNIWERAIDNLCSWMGASSAVMLGVWRAICWMLQSFTLPLFFQTCIAQKTLVTFLFGNLPFETKCFVYACIETFDLSMLNFTLDRSQLESSSKVVNIPLVLKNYLLYHNTVLQECSHWECGAHSEEVEVFLQWLILSFFLVSQGLYFIFCLSWLLNNGHEQSALCCCKGYAGKVGEMLEQLTKWFCCCLEMSQGCWCVEA